MALDERRRQWLRDGIQEAGLDAVVLSRPADVLMATGYFPVVGTSVAIANREGAVYLITPEDEKELAELGGADRVVTFQPGSLDRLRTAAEAIRQPLLSLLQEAAGESGAVGLDEGEASEPASYVAMHLYGSSLSGALEGFKVRPASELLSRMKAALTPRELECVRRACRIAAIAYERGREQVRAGRKESEAASCFREPLYTAGLGFEGSARAGGDAFCMSGVNSAQAFGAYARSRATVIPSPGFVLIHCNSNCDGYWTDITRTYCLGAEEWHRKLYRAVFEARLAALAAIRPGVKGRDVDRAARDAIRSHGFGEGFKHGTGHGVGFAAISGNARPRIHPESEDVLLTGMVFNVEPAIYVDGRGGLRHCDMVAVTGSGAELLTPVHCEIEDLLLSA